jgi:hypothetical protein
MKGKRRTDKVHLTYEMEVINQVHRCRGQRLFEIYRTESQRPQHEE